MAANGYDDVLIVVVALLDGLGTGGVGGANGSLSRSLGKNGFGRSPAIVQCACVKVCVEVRGGVCEVVCV